MSRDKDQHAKQKAFVSGTRSAQTNSGCDLKRSPSYTSYVHYVDYYRVYLDSLRTHSAVYSQDQDKEQVWLICAFKRGRERNRGIVFVLCIALSF
jgi:hypothetical protein